MTVHFDLQTCDYCDRAQADPNALMYHAHCRGCAVRGLAQSPWFHKSKAAGKPQPDYLLLLKAAFGDDWKQAHEDVRREADRIRALRGACKRCGCEMKPGKAIVNRATGYDDFPGVVATMSPGPRHSKLIDCMKCASCGWSVSEPAINTNAQAAAHKRKAR